RTAACDPTQETADQAEAPPSTLVSEADLNETRRVVLDEASVRPIPQTPVKPACAQVLFCNHHLSSAVESGGKRQIGRNRCAVVVVDRLFTLELRSRIP